MDTITQALAEVRDRLSDSLPELLAAALLLVLLLIVGQVVAVAILHVGQKGNRYTRVLARLVRLGAGLVGLVLGLQILGLTALATSLLATGGLLAVILGFAFKEIGENFLAGVFLGMSRSFEVGDLVETSGHMGEVRAIDLRQVWLRSADGRDIFVPSAQIFRNVLVNYTRDRLRRGEFVVGLDYGDAMEPATELLLEVTRGVDGVLEHPAPKARISEFTAQYCELKVLFWVNVSDGSGLSEIRSDVMAACLAALREHGYTLSSDVTSAVSIARDD